MESNTTGDNMNKIVETTRAITNRLAVAELPKARLQFADRMTAAIANNDRNLIAVLAASLAHIDTRIANGGAA